VPGGATPANLYPNAFLWTPRTGIHSLRTLTGDVLSQGLGINDYGQIVGESCQAHLAACRAVLVRNGQMTDLNSLIATTPLTLLNAGDLNDCGTITGAAQHGDATVAYVALPSIRAGLNRCHRAQ
jgi:probable HAF family extracellular repeat protein